jgi:hypothetical protein
MSARLIGAEMVAWSDLDGAHGPGPARGAALAAVAGTARGRTLVAGPHDPSLIDAVAVEDLTVLVRGVADAETLAGRYADRLGVTVLCGGLEKLATTEPYDTVVALDGLARLSSVEGTELGWAEAFELLLGVLAADGSLLLSVENLFGLHRLVALHRDLTDSDWVVSGDHDRGRPLGLARVRARLAGAGLELTSWYAAYPQPVAPALLLGEALLGDERVRGFVEASLSKAGTPREPVLSDPGRLAVDALRHGVAAELAPAWIVAARRGHAPAVPLPDGLVASGATAKPLDAAALPSGRTLADLLLGACLRRDLPAVRELLGAWQAGAAAGVGADQVVVGPDGSLHGLVAAGAPAGALRSFAATLINGGYAHPWPAPTGIDDLALTLAAMTGRELDPAEFADLPPAEEPNVSAYRELAAERDRLTRELAEARAKMQWYEEMLTSREFYLNRANRIVELLTDKGPARAGKALIGGAKAARHGVRVVVKKIKPRT